MFNYYAVVIIFIYRHKFEVSDFDGLLILTTNDKTTIKTNFSCFYNQLAAIQTDQSSSSIRMENLKIQKLCGKQALGKIE